eukprot:4551285-Amphidinium_carterae.1
MVATFDASPWGYGGTLHVWGRLLTWFAEPVTEEDQAYPGVAVGDCRCQGLVEGMAILIGLRAWMPLWRDRLLQVVVKSDSVVALAAVGKFKSRSPQ